MNIFVLLIFLLLIGGAVLYLCRSILLALPGSAPHALRFGLCLSLALAAGIVLGRFLFMGFGSSGFKHLLNTLSSYLMGPLVYFLLFILMADGVLFVLRRVPRLRALSWLRLAATLSALSLTILVCICGFLNARSIKTVSYEITVSEEGEETPPLRMALVSDLHLGSAIGEKTLGDTVRAINATAPDVICIAGDIIDSDFYAIRDPDAAAATLRELSAPLGVYACLGNHDAGSTFPQMEAFFRACGITVLSEEYATLDGRLLLLGRADGTPIGQQAARTDTDALLAARPAELPLVVLDHNPAHVGEYDGRADLILSGHTHHGQIFPGTLVTKYGYYPKGEETPHYIVTSGAGIWGPPMRVGTNAEIVSLLLR